MMTIPTLTSTYNLKLKTNKQQKYGLAGYKRVD